MDRLSLRRGLPIPMQQCPASQGAQQDVLKGRIIIQENGGIFVSGSEPTFADLLIQQSVTMIKAGFWDHIDTNFFDDYAGINATCKKIEENEKVKAYIEAKKK